MIRITELPAGYRWANEFETEKYLGDPNSLPHAILVHRSHDNQGIPYTNNEADLAVLEKS